MTVIEVDDVTLLERVLTRYKWRIDRLRKNIILPTHCYNEPTELVEALTELVRNHGYEVERLSCK